MLPSGIGAFCVHSYKIKSNYWRFKKKIILSETPCSSLRSQSRGGSHHPPPPPVPWRMAKWRVPARVKMMTWEWCQCVCVKTHRQIGMQYDKGESSDTPKWVVRGVRPIEILYKDLYIRSLYKISMVRPPWELPNTRLSSFVKGRVPPFLRKTVFTRGTPSQCGPVVRFPIFVSSNA